VLFVGRLERRKGVQTLVDAWPAIHAAVPDARAMLVGADHLSGPNGGSMKAHLQQSLKMASRNRASPVPDASDSVMFTPQVDRQTLPKVYATAQVCVVPSLFENFPYTCLEAMACGCAVVASRVGGIPEIIEDQVDGLLVEPNDPAALVDAVLRLLRSPSLRQELGTAARRSVERRFSRRVVCAQTAEVYREALSC